MSNTLTLKQKKFLKFYIESGNASDSARKAGYKQDVSGRENLQKPTIQAALQQILDKNDLTEARIAKCIDEGLKAMKPISCNVYVKTGEGGQAELANADGLTKDFVDVEDYSVRHKYLETLIKLKGIADKADDVFEIGPKGTSLTDFVAKYNNVEITKGEDGISINASRKPTPTLNKFLARQSG